MKKIASRSIITILSIVALVSTASTQELAINNKKVENITSVDGAIELLHQMTHQTSRPAREIFSK